MQQGSSNAASNNAAVLTDEQILGIESVGIAPPTGAPSVSGDDDFSEHPATSFAAAPQHGADPARIDSRAANHGEQNKARMVTQSAASANQQDPTDANNESAASASTVADPAWLRALDAQPEAAAEARRWRAAATDAAQLDAAYFSADAGARIGLAARLYDTDPGAFRAMLAEGARMLSQRDPQGLAELARQLGAADGASAQAPTAAMPKSVAQAARPYFRRDAGQNPAQDSRQGISENVRQGIGQDARQDNRHDFQQGTAPDARQDAWQDSRQASRQGIAQDATQNDGRNFRQAGVQDGRGPRQAGAEAQRQAGAEGPRQGAQNSDSAAFPADAYREFQSAANDAVGRRVHDAIDNTLRATLPEGIADGARRRMGDDIFREVHTALSADRDLARQIGDVLQGWRFDAAARQQVTSLVAGRARVVLPEVARRVVAEWTSSVLASDRAKTARIAAAASRHDITGGRLPEPIPASALRPRDIDYGRLSDDQILAL